MKKKLAIFLAALCLAILAAGCGSSGAGASGTVAASNEMTAGNSSPAKGDFGQMELMSTPQANSAAQIAEGHAKDGQTQEAKRIYTADMRLETTAFDEAAKGLSALVEELGGWMESSSVDYGGSGYRYGNYAVRIPQEKFDTFIARAGALCHVVYSGSNVQDVSEMYYDTAGRLETQKTKLERLQTLLSQAKDMEDIITIESAISDTEGQIESLSGELRHYDSQVDYATVTLSLSEVYQLSNVEQPATGFLSRVAGALSSGAHEFVSLVQGAVVLLAYAWVWVVLVAAGLIAVVFILRKRKVRPVAEQKPLPEKPDDKQE